MVPAQLGKVGSHLVRRGQALHDPAEGMEQPVPLLIHGGREQLAKLRPAKEQLAVEEAHRLVASVRSTSAPATRALSLCGDSARLPSRSRRHPPDLGTSLKLSPVPVGELTWLSAAGHHCLPSRSSAYSPQTHEHVGYLYDPIRLVADRSVRLRNFI